LGIADQMTFTAYETTTVKSQLKLQKTNDYRTYTNEKGKKYIALVIVENASNGENKQGNKNSTMNGNRAANEKIKVVIQSDNDFEEEMVDKASLSSFP
jgi:hypothetical protein